MKIFITLMLITTTLQSCTNFNGKDLNVQIPINNKKTKELKLKTSFQKKEGINSFMENYLLENIKDENSLYFAYHAGPLKNTSPEIIKTLQDSLLLKKREESDVIKICLNDSTKNKDYFAKKNYTVYPVNEKKSNNDLTLTDFFFSLDSIFEKQVFNLENTVDDNITIINLEKSLEVFKHIFLQISLISGQNNICEYINENSEKKYDIEKKKDITYLQNSLDSKIVKIYTKLQTYMPEKIFDEINKYLSNSDDEIPKENKIASSEIDKVIKTQLDHKKGVLNKIESENSPEEAEKNYIGAIHSNYHNFQDTTFINNENYQKNSPFVDQKNILSSQYETYLRLQKIYNPKENNSQFYDPKILTEMKEAFSIIKEESLKFTGDNENEVLESYHKKKEALIKLSPLLGSILTSNYESKANNQKELKELVRVAREYEEIVPEDIKGKFKEIIGEIEKFTLRVKKRKLEGKKNVHKIGRKLVIDEEECDPFFFRMNPIFLKNLYPSSFEIGQEFFELEESSQNLENLFKNLKFSELANFENLNEIENLEDYMKSEFFEFINKIDENLDLEKYKYFFVVKSFYNFFEKFLEEYIFPDLKLYDCFQKMSFFNYNKNCPDLLMDIFDKMEYDFLKLVNLDVGNFFENGEKMFSEMEFFLNKFLEITKTIERVETETTEGQKPAENFETLNSEDEND